jgi:hypothetical protein
MRGWQIGALAGVAVGVVGGVVTAGVIYVPKLWDEDAQAHSKKPAPFPHPLANAPVMGSSPGTDDSDTSLPESVRATAPAQAADGTSYLTWQDDRPLYGWGEATMHGTAESFSGTAMYQNDDPITFNGAGGKTTFYSSDHEPGHMLLGRTADGSFVGHLEIPHGAPINVTGSQTGNRWTLQMSGDGGDLSGHLFTGTGRLTDSQISAFVASDYAAAEWQGQNGPVV